MLFANAAGSLPRARMRDSHESGGHYAAGGEAWRVDAAEPGRVARPASI